MYVYKSYSVLWDCKDEFNSLNIWLTTYYCILSKRLFTVECYNIGLIKLIFLQQHSHICCHLPFCVKNVGVWTSERVAITYLFIIHRFTYLMTWQACRQAAHLNFSQANALLRNIIHLKKLIFSVCVQCMCFFVKGVLLWHIMSWT